MTSKIRANYLKASIQSVKRTHFPLILLAILIFSFSANGNEPNWYLKLKQIKPLQSSNREVERIFKSPKIIQSSEKFGIRLISYQTPEGDLTIQYSTGVCAAKDPDPESYFVETYRVKKDIVLEAIFFPKKNPSFFGFKIDKRQVVETQEEEDPASHFINKKRGIDYVVQLGKVRLIKLFIPAGLDNSKCS